MKNFKNIIYLIPIFFYYLAESFLIALFVNLVWKFLLYSTFKIGISYFQWVGIIWIVKIIFFDIFKFYNVANNINNNLPNNELS